MNPFGISIIICIHNGASKITPTLKALSEQTIPSGIPIELLIIDNASTDNTAIIAQKTWEISGSPFPIKILTEPKLGKANALKNGYSSASYELMLLCDDDNWLQPNYLNIVIALFREHPNIGLLGGYGKAFFETSEKPEWFDKWENCYVCGKHHRQNGFLANRDYSIWGAGSVITKTVWNFIISNGFSFHNSTKGGKAIAEDAELSMAISFTGYKLYFDDRLWFTHDLRGGRITWKNLIAQQAANGKNNAILCMYEIALNLKTNSNAYANYLFIKKTFEISFRLLKSSLKRENKPRQIYFSNILKELLFNANKYKKISLESFNWINKVKNNPKILD
jgi:glycosyltransferase involved in cell wall biosynthesis